MKGDLDGAILEQLKQIKELLQEWKEEWEENE